MLNINFVSRGLRFTSKASFYVSVAYKQNYQLLINEAFLNKKLNSFKQD